MSGVFRGIKKVFKKVAKVVKKVLPVVVAAAAIYFTAGAAMGVAGGGWAGAAGKIGATFGEGVLGSAITGAVKHAGYGALTGGVIAGATGQSVSKGMMGGAAAGAVLGGITGTVSGMAGAPAAPPTATPTASPVVGTAPPAGTGLMPGAQAKSDFLAVLDGGAAGGPATLSSPVGTTATETAGRGLLGKGGWVERNQTLAGNVVAGLGSGLSASAEADAIRDRDAQRRRNYEGADPSTGFTPMASPEGADRPADRFDHRRYAAFDYKYNRQTGRIERVPTGNG